MPTIIAGIQEVLSKYGSLINQYRGEIPASVVAARVWHETRGNPCPKPTACCDEQGLLQLWPATRQKYGVTDACDPAQALYGGCAHWMSEANRLRSWLQKNGYPVPYGYEFWALAYLYTAIGAGATRALIKASGTSNFSSLASWVANNNIDHLSGSFGSQSPSSIKTRVKNARIYVSAAYKVGGGIGILLVGGVAGYLIWKWWVKR
jgi:hypothetical protein